MKVKRPSYWVDQSIKGYWIPIAVRTTRDHKIMAAEIMWDAKYQGEAPASLRVHSVLLVLKSTKPDFYGAPWARYERPA